MVSRDSSFGAGDGDGDGDGDEKVTRSDGSQPPVIFSTGASSSLHASDDGIEIRRGSV